MNFKNKENIIFGINWNFIVNKMKEILFDKFKFLGNVRNELFDERDFMIIF